MLRFYMATTGPDADYVNIFSQNDGSRGALSDVQAHPYRINRPVGEADY
jgi:hypothetical protein